jgi:hypothetical protein
MRHLNRYIILQRFISFRVHIALSGRMTVNYEFGKLEEKCRGQYLRRKAEKTVKKVLSRFGQIFKK